jgi:hypothetical protein
MEHQADVYPQLRLIRPGAGPGCEKNGRSATWAVTTRSGRHQVPVAVLPTAKSLSAFSLKPQSDRLLDPGSMPSAGLMTNRMFMSSRPNEDGLMELKGFTIGVIFKRCTAQLRFELRLAFRKRLGFKSNRAIGGRLILQ